MMVDRWTSENGDPDNFMNVLIGGQRGRQPRPLVRLRPQCSNLRHLPHRRA